jgi:alkylation response protein AidB-like acyl-CoA dehydrogenase
MPAPARPPGERPGLFAEPSGPLAELRGRVRDFIDREVIPSEDELDGEPGAGSADLMRELQRKAKAEGLWALGLPADLGGGGLSLLEYAFINEVIGRSEAAIEALGTLQTQDAMMLDRYATASQRARWLAPLVAGEILPATGMTEPEAAGSDPRQVRTRALMEDGHWVINGHKWFTSNADRAGFVTVLARTDDPEVSAAGTGPGAPQFSMIIVPAGTPGFEVVRVIRTMGDTAGHHCEVRLRDVRVPADHLLGERGRGLDIGKMRLGPGRIFHCMRWLGQAQRAFELMCERANSRHAHGSLLAQKGAVQRFIAESATEIQASRLLTLDAAAKLDAGADASAEISMIKVFGARMLHNVIDRAIQVHGALGVSGDAPLERMYRRARYARIYDGPDEVHEMVVARRILRDPRNVPWV